ncbi:mycofactocin biosynthesis glycosyltransferase MftF [Microbacterium sp. HD4P20]|uniref:mycofactocin biosynthesis glycosyltransferase MftF n=1 Tax=Microbacterium sp. HD4P20 TaxID=2864874 RepID=UPI001C6411B8|nr:mycofactocin biosynthesis glycosyltransferase MftF [Microbacterium sp. HD4P20]MCP2636311.1 mycofactocin biosynthesis glycosyltransferase MftF [Microbacterium sp. HD4P20]
MTPAERESPQPHDKELPRGTVAVVGADVWRYDRGRMLVGGAPTRVMRLSAMAAGLIQDGRIAASDPASMRLVARLVDAGIAHPDPASLPPIGRETVTVVIPVYGRPRELARLLAGLAGMRVVVVDDGTPERDARALHDVVARGGAQLLRLDENVGPASARNRGLAIATTPFVAFVDSDVTLTPDDVERMLRHFGDPGLALIGPRVAGIPRHGTWIERYENTRSSVDLGRRHALVRPRSPVAWLSSTCLVARREALGGGFTDGMRVGEDVDLVWRLAEAGWRVRYDPTVTVSHEHRAYVRPWLARKLFYGTGAAALAARHPEAIPPAILRPWSASVVVLLLCARWWSVPAALAVALATAWRLSRRLGTGEGTRILPLRLAGGGVLGALTQTSALALRHWWPLAAVAAAVSRRARWIIGTMAVVDAVVEHRRLRADLDFVRFAVARRLDDVAYGAGVWWGCLRRADFRALRIELTPSARRSRTRTDDDDVPPAP